MANKEPSQSLFKRHKIFALIFSFLFLALLLASVAVVQQQQTIGSKAATTCRDVKCSTFSQSNCTKHKGCKLVNCSGRYCACGGGTTRVCTTPPPPKKCSDYAQADCTKHSECKLANCSGRYCQCVAKTSGGGGSGGGDTANCGAQNQKCCATQFGNICKGAALFCQGGICKPLACGTNNSCPSGKQCVNFRYGNTCVRKTSAGGMAKCPDGKGGTGQACCPDNMLAPNGKNCRSSSDSCKGGKCVAPVPAAPAAPAPNGGSGGGGGTTGGAGGGGTTGGGGPAPTGKTPTPPGKTGNVTLNLKLKFQGITSQPSSQFNSLKVKVSLSESVSGTGDFTADANGVWTGKVSLANAPIGRPVSIFVKGPKHLQKRICVPAPTETRGGTFTCQNAAITLKAGNNTLDFSKILLLVGDLPTQDGVVDSNDVSFIRQNLTNTDSSALAIGDVNLNGVIDSQDYSLVIAALSIKTDDAIK